MFAVLINAPEASNIENLIFVASAEYGCVPTKLALRASPIHTEGAAESPCAIVTIPDEGVTIASPNASVLNPTFGPLIAEVGVEAFDPAEPLFCSRRLPAKT